MQPVLVVAGQFTIAGTILANRIATYDPVTGAWSPLGSGVDGVVYALTTLPNGDLVAGGHFTTAGGAGASSIARWNGTSWSPLGSGIDIDVYALTTLPNGDLVAAGTFTTAGGVSASNIARWDGTSWSPLGSGIGSHVYALTALPSGDLVAGGYFSTAGGVSASCIARWDGTSWSPLGTGMSGPLGFNVRALTVMANGDLVAGGPFTSAGGVSASSIARWDGTSWSALGTGLGMQGSSVFAFATLPNGDLLAGGTFSIAGGLPARCVARWNGTSWAALGSGLEDVVRALTTLPNGDVVAGGLFDMPAVVSADHIARWNGTSWSPLGSGINAGVYAVTTMPNGDLVAGGAFTTAGDVSANYIARWDGTSWSALGSGFAHTAPFLIPAVYTLLVLPNGDLVAGGGFTIAGGVTANHVARWNGTIWSALGPGLGAPDTESVQALALLPNGDLVAGGTFTTAGGAAANFIARWDGTSWSALGSGIPSFTMPGNFVRALTVLPNGDLVAGGRSGTFAGGPHIARWDGTSWSSLGFMNDAVTSLATMPNGDLVAGGAFTTIGGVSANRIARWNGTSWSALGSGFANPFSSSPWPFALKALPNGDLVAGGRFRTAGGVGANYIARWNGASWSPFGSGTNFDVHAFTKLPNGDLVAGGDFTVVDGAVSAHVAQLTTTCPATAVAYGAGCTGSGGPNVLAATSLPWVGSTFRSVATGMPALALAVGVFGFSPASVPMPSILPQGVPGCTLLVTPDLLELHVPAAGMVQTQVVIPNSVALAGAVLHHQVVPIELSGSGSFTALTGTNALTLTVGSL